MIISVDKNRKYNGMLNDIRKALYKDVDSKTFRKMIKDLDPKFPMTEDGSSKISMRDITEVEFAAHLSFVKTMCIKQGLRLEYFTEGDVIVAKEAVFQPIVTDRFEEVDGGVLSGVVCSNCGCETVRMLSNERYDEIKSITLGEKKESFTPLSASFICIKCFSLRSEDNDDPHVR